MEGGRGAGLGGRGRTAPEGQRGRPAMLMRFDPFRELDWISEELLHAGRVRQMPLDAYRRGDEFKVYLDMPGADPSSIELTVEKDVLSVRATRTLTAFEGDEIQVTERDQGEFSRELFFGESL